MFEGRINNLLSIEALKQWNSLAFTFFFSVMVLTTMTPKSLGFSTGTKFAAHPVQVHRFKIEAPIFSGMEEATQNDDPQTGTWDPKPALGKNKLFHPIIDRAAEKFQIDPDLVRAIIFAESGYNPRAVSKRGAMGLMQLMPGTAKAMGVEDCFDPEHNIFGGVKYFKKLCVQFNGDVKLALAAYNAGSRKVREFNGVPPFKTTERYIQKVMKNYKKYKSQQTGQLDLS